MRVFYICITLITFKVILQPLYFLKLGHIKLLLSLIIRSFLRRELRDCWPFYINYGHIRWINQILLCLLLRSIEWGKKTVFCWVLRRMQKKGLWKKLRNSKFLKWFHLKNKSTNHRVDEATFIVYTDTISRDTQLWAS